MFGQKLLFFQILDSLDMDNNCKKMHLSHKLENVACTLEGEEASTCWHPVDYLCSDLNDVNNTYNNSSLESFYDNNRMHTLTGTNPNNTNTTNQSSDDFNVDGDGGNYVHNILDTFDNDKVGFSKFF